MKKLIITAAVTGSATLPSQTPYLPITPEQIAEEAYQAWEAGSAIVHIHARDSKDGRPTPNLDVYREIVTKIKKKCNVIVCITTGGALGMTAEERVRVVPTFKPELSSFNMGSMNFCLAPVLEEIKEFRHDWEREYVEITYKYPFLNTFKDLEYFCKTMEEHGTKPECEVYDVGHIYNIAYLIRKGVLKQEPIWIQFVTGTLGGIGRAVDDLLYLKRTSDRLFGQDKYEWSVIGTGYPWEFQAAAIAIMMNGHVRVGLEDNIYIGRGELAKSNAELVAKVVRLAEEFGRDVASPDEARKMLNLKGLEQVNF
ncbi:MAG: hypothetical protein AOA65_1597 [Candidatus Bathyarchaeota archaeon BA1]|nr:MAG: hypothetical protein AOA65_1597 [Candidatus Bathyarchaeota archaeon BA1]